MPKIAIVSALAALGLSAAAPALAQAPASTAAAASASAPQPKNDYADGKTWLCKPGRQDACAVNLDTTVIAADGSATVERFAPAADAKIDCFYIYPTVSRDPTPNADMNPGPEETQVVKQQFARFASVCRPFAPLYRQITLTALTAGIMGKPMAVDRALAYDDVKDAWDYYLAHDNHGRGVVLIGHSQGSGMLIELVKREIDGKPVQKQVLSVILGGARLQVPVGKDVGGDFKSVPLCRAPDQIGCAINFASFRATNPPPANSRFGVSSAEGLEAACVNPAALGGGTGAIHAYLASGTEKIVAVESPDAQKAWTTPPVAITTPFVSVPGLITAECARTDKSTYLAIALHPGAADKRTGQIAGDVILFGKVQADWGLHLIDMNLAQGDLVDLTARQYRAWAKKR